MGSMSMGDNLQNMGSEEFSSNFSPSSFTGGGQPEDFDPSQFRRDSDSTAEKNFVLYLACFALLAAALLFAGLYRRKPRKR